MNFFNNSQLLFLDSTLLVFLLACLLPSVLLHVINTIFVFCLVSSVHIERCKFALNLSSSHRVTFQFYILLLSLSLSFVDFFMHYPNIFEYHASHMIRRNHIHISIYMQRRLLDVLDGGLFREISTKQRFNNNNKIYTFKHKCAEIKCVEARHQLFISINKTKTQNTHDCHSESSLISINISAQASIMMKQNNEKTKLMIHQRIYKFWLLNILLV